MKIFCAWCGADMGEKDGLGVEGVTHSICPACEAKLMFSPCCPGWRRYVKAENQIRAEVGIGDANGQTIQSE